MPDTNPQASSVVSRICNLRNKAPVSCSIDMGPPTFDRDNTFRTAQTSPSYGPEDYERAA